MHNYTTGWTVQGSILSRDRKVFSAPKISTLALQTIQPPIQWVSGALSPVVKQLGCEVDHSPQSRAEVKNEGSCISTPSISLYEGHRDNFTLVNKVG